MLGKKRQQTTFGELEAEARVPQGHFLRQVDHKIDWQPFQAELERLNPSRRGRPSYPPLMLFKALLLQCWYNLSDPGLEEAIRDRLSFQRFLGLCLTDPVPDETTLCRFRGLLTRNGVGPRLLGLLDEQLQGQGLIVRQGSLVDATLLKAQPRPPKKGQASPDPEADWTRKGKDGHFGYKAHLTVDQGSGLVRRIKLTKASHAETHLLEEMLLGDEAAVFADGAYAKDARKTALRRRGVFCGIVNRAWRFRGVSPRQHKRNRFFRRIRVAVERVIGTLKRHYGIERLPYVGQARNWCHLLLVSMCYNLKRMLVLQGSR